MKRLIVILLPVFFMFGCASVPKESKVDTKRADLSKPFTNEVVATAASDKRPQLFSSCPSEEKTLDGVEWTKLLDFANGCVRKNNWKMTEAIGNKLAKDTSHSPWGPYYLSLVAEKEGNLQKAIWMNDLALKRSPNVGLLAYQKGRLLWKSGAFEESVEYFEKSVSLNVNVASAHFFLGQIYLRDQDMKTAKAQFESVLKLNPVHFESLVEMAKIYNISGDSSNELIFLERAKRVKPGDSWIKQRLSILITKNTHRDPASKPESNDRGNP